MTAGIYRQAHRFAGFGARGHIDTPLHERVNMLLCEAGYPGSDGATFRPNDQVDLHIPSYDELIQAHKLAGSL